MIYIDASRYSNTTRKTGVENYSYQLIRELAKTHAKEITLISPRKVDLELKQIIIPFPRLWTLVRLSWEILKNRSIDNLFVPSHVLPLIHPKKTVITIHDVVFCYSPKSYSLAARLYLNWATKFAVKRATKIITPSETTKKDLIHFYRADPKKIVVIPLGFDANHKKQGAEQKSILQKNNLRPKQYFLFLGRIEYKKNTDTLIKAFDLFTKKNRDMKLVLAGFPGHGGKTIINSIPSNIKDRIILTGYINEDEKRTLLQNTLAFIFPSRFEGFGIPLLEAMEAEIPIIASDIPSSREVAGDLIHFFPKTKIHALTKLMQKIHEMPTLKKDCIVDYEKKLKKFSWKTCAKKTFELLQAK